MLGFLFFILPKVSIPVNAKIVGEMCILHAQISVPVDTGTALLFMSWIPYGHRKKDGRSVPWQRYHV